MNEWHIFGSTRELDRALAAHLGKRLQTDIDLCGHASLALSGGSTPAGMFSELSRCELDWSRVWLTLVDERRVASDNPASNERMLRENLLHNRAAAARFVSLADNGAGGLAALGRALDDIPRPFSAVVLGMGGDGHTASWFPGAANLPALLDPANPADVAETTPPTAPHRRLTLTLAAVLNSREIIIHITGDAKKTLLENARVEEHPVAAILQQTATPATIWWAPQ